MNLIQKPFEISDFDRESFGLLPYHSDYHGTIPMQPIPVLKWCVLIIDIIFTAIQIQLTSDGETELVIFSISSVLEELWKEKCSLEST